MPDVNESKSLRRVSGQNPLIGHRFRSSQRWWHFSPLSRLGEMEKFCSIFAVWVQIWPPYTLCKWKQIIEKSSGQDPLVCHRFQSSQRWCHFSPLSMLGKMEQFCSIFAVWVQIWPPYNLCKWKQILWRDSGQDPLICHRFRSSHRWWHISPLSRLGKIEQFCSIFAVLSKFDHLIPYVF